MKAKIVITILLCVSALSFTLHSGKMFENSANQTAGSPVSTYPDTTFLIGALHDGEDYGFQNLDELEFNFWHIYIGGITGWLSSGATNDSLNTHINVYGPQIQDILDDISSHNMKSIIMRPKVFWLCYGERSDYQCENINLNHDLWFYSFNVSKLGTYIQDIPDNTHGNKNGDTVKYCHGDPSNASSRADTIVKRLKANTEQCWSYSFIASANPPIKNWLIKPRIRIDSAKAYDPQNPAICNIKVIGEKGDSVLKNVDIHANDFLVDPGGNYDGRYIEKFNLPSGDSLKINGHWGSNWGNAARGNSSIDTANKIDIQVYWYGSCDMWIDYVRVDNEIADRLLKIGGDLEYEDWLNWEAEQIACHGDSPLKFYLELFKFNNIPCMAYTSRKLDSLVNEYCGKNITLTALMSPLYMIHLPWEERFTIMNAGHVKRNYVDKVGLSDILIANYPFYTN